MKELFREPCVREGQICRFIPDEAARPHWSKLLHDHLISQGGLQMERRYAAHRKVRANDPLWREFYETVSGCRGVIVDLASGPSGYFAPVIDALEPGDTFIITDACRAVLDAHAAANRGKNVLLVDTDLDRPLPFADGCIDAFTGYLASNVEQLRALLGEVYRCLKPGGKLYLVDLFFESGSPTSLWLAEREKVTATLEAFLSHCTALGFTWLGGRVLKERCGKIDPQDLLPLEDWERSQERSLCFQK